MKTVFCRLPKATREFIPALKGRVNGAFFSHLPVSQWLKQVVATNDDLLVVLANFLNRQHSQNGDDPVRITLRLDPYWFKPYLEPETIRERVQDLASSGDLTGDQQLAVLQFLQEYEDRDAGLDPESMFYTPRRTVFDNVAVERGAADSDDEAAV